VVTIVPYAVREIPRSASMRSKSGAADEGRKVSNVQIFLCISGALFWFMGGALFIGVLVHVVWAWLCTQLRLSRGFYIAGYKAGRDRRAARVMEGRK
jgi:hypothetical protein